MAYIIPNAVDTGGSRRYANINQAEPDSVDIEVLGNRANWVRSGCACGLTNSATVTVANGTVVINNVPYFVTGGTRSISSPSLGAKTTLVVARLSSGTATIQLISGPDSTTNPVYPTSKSVSSSGTFDPSTDVLLAAIYSTPDGAEWQTGDNDPGLVDKRIVNPIPVSYSLSGVPDPEAKDMIGDTVLVTSTGVLYVKSASGNTGTWIPLASQNYADNAGIPIGSIFAWGGVGVPGGTSASVNYLSCDGQTAASSTYPALFAQFQTTYGTTTTPGHFVLPNLNDDRTIIGGTNNLGTTGGSNTYTINANNLPVHDHAISVQAHGDNGRVTHGTGASATAGTSAATGGNHTHPIVKHFHKGALVYRRYDDHNRFHIHDMSHPDTFTAGDNVTHFHVDALGIDEGNTNPDGMESSLDTTEPESKAAFENSSPVTTQFGGSHNHSLVIPDHVGLTHTATATPFGQASPTAIPTLPKHMKLRWYVRAK